MRFSHHFAILALAAIVAGCGGGGGSAGGEGTSDMEMGSLTVSVQGEPTSRVSATVSTFSVIGLAGASFSKVQFNLPPITQATPEQVRKATSIAYLTPNNVPMVYSYATGDSRRLIPGQVPYYAYSIDFFPSGRKLALLVFSASGSSQIATVNADGTGFQVIVSGYSLGPGVSVSPDGSKIVFTNYSNGIGGLMTCNANGTGRAQITTGSALGSHWYADWMSGGRIAFLYSTQTGSRVMAVNADGTNPVDLTGSDLPIWGLSVAPAATMKAYFRNIDTGYVLQTTPLSGNSAVYQSPAYTSSGQISWAPDGNQLLYGSGSQLYLSEVGAAPDRPLIAGAQVPAWGPYVPKTTLVGTGGLLLPASAGFLFAHGDSYMTSLVAFDAATRTTAKIRNLESSNGSESLVYDVTADNLKAFAYKNSMTGQTVTVIDPAKTTTYAKGAIVSFDPETGGVANVITHDAIGTIARSTDRNRLKGRFLEMWDGEGRHRSLQGVTELKVDPATGVVGQ